MKMFLDGNWVDREEKINVVNPFDGEIFDTVPKASVDDVLCAIASRSEERRVGKECRSRWSPYH